MSQSALLRAVKARLQSVLTIDGSNPPNDLSLDIMFDGEPKALCGQTFIAIWPGEWRGEDIEGLEETFGVAVTVTRRLGAVPSRSWGTEVWAKAASGLEVVLRSIVAAIHLDVGADAILNAANTIIGGSANGFTEPLRFRDGGRPEKKGPEWFSATEPLIAGQKFANAGVAQTLTFGGAKRFQTIESMT